MDPITQGLLGAAAAQAVLGRKVPHAGLLGAVGGMIPDLDVLIKSDADPLLAIEYHRQFTHSLAFIPLGGTLASLPFFVWRKYRAQWKPVVGAAIAGYATHGLLDACTTYGTQLFWPFTDYRVSWSWISIVDLIFTFALFLGVLLAAFWKPRTPAITALAFCLAYLGLGAVQHQRALAAQERIAKSRGHRAARGDTFPTLANNIVWRSLYEADGLYYADRIRVPWFAGAAWSNGASVPVVNEDDLPADERAHLRVVEDFRRFRWFSNGWVARAPDEPEVIGDVRYSLRTDAFEPIWGVRFHPEKRPVTEWVSRTRDRDLQLSNLWQEIMGGHPGYRALP